MAHRVTLAQTELQLAQSAPDMHNLHEAFRRMYRAVGVKDVDSLLKPVDEGDPVPKDPAVENSESLDNLPLVPFEGQNHDAHIMAHLVFGSSQIVAQVPQVAMALQKHVMEHVSLKSKEQVFAQFSQQLQGQPPSPEQALEIEAAVANLIAQGMQEVKALSAQISGQGQEGPDPLIALKEQDLQLRAQKDQAELQLDQERLNLERQKAETNAQLGAERIQTTEDIAQARIQAAKERELMKQRQEQGRN